MGNCFSYYFNNQKYDDSLTTPLNDEDLNNEDIKYEQIDIDNINKHINVLEDTTQSSLKNISLDITFLFKEINNLKINIEKINSVILKHKNNININPHETSIYMDANSDIEKED